MAELAPADLPAAVLARFADDAAAQKAIDAALVAARRYCGWPVSPSRSETIMVDGPGGRVLSLPTLNLTAVTSVIELGVVVDVSKLDVSQRKGTVTKQFGYWTGRDGAISVTITHGYAEADALDWRVGIIELVDLRSRESERDTSDMITKKVDDVEYQWVGDMASVNSELAAKLDQFRILPSP